MHSSIRRAAMLIAVTAGMAACATESQGAARADQPLPVEISCPSEHIGLFRNYVGAWAVEEWTYRTSPGQYETTTAEATIIPILGGCGIRETFTGFKTDQSDLSGTMQTGA